MQKYDMDVAFKTWGRWAANEILLLTTKNLGLTWLMIEMCKKNIYKLYIYTHIHTYMYLCKYEFMRIHVCKCTYVDTQDIRSINLKLLYASNSNLILAFCFIVEFRWLAAW